jgi:hypothetical protein
MGSAATSRPQSWTDLESGRNFNGDGHSDILCQNANGQASIWEMNGTNIIAED